MHIHLIAFWYKEYIEMKVQIESDAADVIQKPILQSYTIDKSKLCPWMWLYSSIIKLFHASISFHVATNGSNVLCKMIKSQSHYISDKYFYCFHRYSRQICEMTFLMIHTIFISIKLNLWLNLFNIFHYIGTNKMATSPWVKLHSVQIVVYKFNQP